jgi:Cft2 family RNA processing exonuclease
MAWEIQYRNGLWLPQIGWWLDARAAVARSFVSHAHSDHIAAHGEIVASAATARLLRARLGGARREHVLPFGRTEALAPDTAVTLHPAGHILGSAQCLLAHDRHGTLLYTGDFKLRAGFAAEPCATPHADVLIMESTFGLPRYVFPPAAEVMTAIAGFCRQALADGATPVLYAYSLGKSQELMRGLAASGLPLMVHPQTLKLCRIYEELGLGLPPHREFAAGGCAGHVVICPPPWGRATLLAAIPRARTAVVTGWALEAGAIYRYQCDAAFPLSDHADFNELLAFVGCVAPRLVYTVHGFARELAQTLRARGVEAWALGADNQLELRLDPAVLGAGLPPAEDEDAGPE